MSINTEDQEVSKQSPCWDGYVQRGTKPGKDGNPVPNCVPVAKAEDFWEDDDSVTYEDDLQKADGYVPPEGVRSAARRAIKFKEDGKANGAGTAVGWTRARQLANGETLTLSTVKRMYSYFSRHEVDKKGKDWGNDSNPSNGYIMWLAWGGDAGFSWSRKIVAKEKNMEKKDYSTEARQTMSESGEAMPDGSFPIKNESDLRNAIQSVGRAKNYAAAKRHIMRRARALGLTNLLPESWNVKKFNDIIDAVQEAVDSFAKSDETTAEQVMADSNAEIEGTEESFGDNNGMPQDHEALNYQTNPGSDTETGADAAEDVAEEPKEEQSPWAGFFAPIKPKF